MRQKSRLPGPQPHAAPASPSASERLIRDIRRKHHSAEAEAAFYANEETPARIAA